MLSGATPWPDPLADRYRRAGYWARHTLGELLREPAAVDPVRIAVATAVDRIPYGVLDRRADRIAGALYRDGVRAGDRWVVQLPNSIDLVALLVGLFRLGVVPVLALLAHRRAEIGYLCELTGATGLVVPDVLLGFDHCALAREVVAAVPSVRKVIVRGVGNGFETLVALDAEPVDPPPPDPEDVAFCMLSGGTTGLPKLIPRTHADYLYQMRETATAMRLGRDGAYLAALPMVHNAALGCPGVLGALWAGAKAVLARTPAPDEVFPLIAAEGVTLTTLMPAFLPLWEATADLFAADLSGLVVEVGGARLDAADAVRAETTLGCTLTRWFGMGEGLLSFSRLDDPPDVRLGTEGRPLSPADELRVVDDAGRSVPLGEVGELVTQGPCTLRGYYRAPEYNAQAFTPDGLLRTGDLVRFTRDGDLVVTGRIKDVVNRGGEKVPTGEVEDHLRAHPRVHDVAVLAAPDAGLGEKTCAALVPAGPPPSLVELRGFLADRGLADFKQPDLVEYVDSLPRTPIGKVDKRALGELLTRAAPVGGGS